MLQIRTVREQYEEREKDFMSPYGCLSSESRGRLKEEPPCDVRAAFQLDKIRIVYSNAFRRLKHKTQVFLSPLGEHYRTRLTHTLEVAQISRTVARALRLNEDLCEAIALGHDLGHTPFGHSGEIALKEVFSPDFCHNEQSLRVVDVLENDGKGLNLTHEVRDGILKHSKGFGKIIPDNSDELPYTIEGRIVRIADIMAYLNHDLDDAIRSGVIVEKQVPEVCNEVIGHTHSQRATNMIKDMIYSTRIVNGELCVNTSEKMFSAMAVLRQFLLENVYLSPSVHNEFVKAKKILIQLYHFFIEHPQKFEKELGVMELEACDHANKSYERSVADFIASMTDRHALDLYTKIFIPVPLV